MKKIVFILLSVITFYCNAQDKIILTTGDSVMGTISEIVDSDGNIDADHVRILKSDGKSSIVSTKMIKNLNEISSVTSGKSGDNFKTAKFGALSERGRCGSYISSDGIEYKVGDTLKIGMPSGLRTFAFITSMDIMGTVSPASASFSNTEVVIKKINVIGSERTGYKASFQTKATAVSNFFLDFESALKVGEVSGKKGTISSDEALSLLKKAKDKMDLGLITPEEYAKQKDYLRKFIK